MLRFLYQFFYTPWINRIFRLGLYPFRNVFKTIREIPVSGKLKIKLEAGHFFLWSNPTSFISRKVYWQPVEYFEYIPLFYKLAVKSSVFYDIGANVGLYAIIYSKINLTGLVAAFEPSPGPYWALNKNIELNHLEGVKTYQLALSDEEGSTNFFDAFHPKYPFVRHQLGSVGSLERKPENFPSRTIDVMMKSLDKFIGEEALPPPDLIKMDTEGTEHKVLMGMRHILTKHRPLIITELLYELNEDKIEDQISGIRYKRFQIRENVLFETPTLLRFEDDGVRNVLLVPEEKLDLVAPYIKSQ